jgi:hypothetical protein
MLILKENEVCPHGSICPYNQGVGGCYGAVPNRNTVFQCEYVINGKIVEGGARIPGDITGKMKVLID